ncbi:MAG: hypothetical protein NW205_05460 [Hyphomicrobiaceae bacterium]|nr:hypothetical protein [Hyphomicrobiaceae bacterium]
MGETGRAPAGGEPGTSASEVKPVATVTAGWFVRRALVGIAMLTVFVSSFAWLLHAAIDPELEARESILEAIARIALNF